MTPLDDARSRTSKAIVALASSGPLRPSPTSGGLRLSPSAATATCGRGRSEAHATDLAPITVAIGQFGALIHRGLTEVIGEDLGIEIVASELDVPALLRSMAWRAPQVAVLDAEQVGDPSGLCDLRAVAPQTGIVLLAHRPSLARSVTLFAAGAMCVSMDASARAVVLALRIAAAGRHFPANGDDDAPQSLGLSDRPILTPRETEVLEHLSKGRSHAEVARALNIGESTELTHAAAVRRKLKVRSKRDLIGFPISALGGQHSLTV